MVRIPYLSAARFTGEQAADFLQSQLTADIAALDEGAATFACYCTPKGQVLGLLRVRREGDDFLVAGAAELLPGILQRLKMFVFRSKVAFEMVEDLAVCGDAEGEYVFATAGGCEDGDPAVWKAKELRDGIAWLGAGGSEKFIPQMLGFEALGALSFSKGCYPGQEIVARARYLGTVKRKPLILEVEGEVTAAPGEKLRVRRGEETSDAVVVDSAPAGKDRTVIFSVARAEPEEPAFEIEYGDARYRCATI